MNSDKLGTPTTLITIKGENYEVVGYNFTANWAQLVFPDASTISINITDVDKIYTEIIEYEEEETKH